MNIRYGPRLEHGIVLCGILAGIVLIVAGIVAIVLIIRASKIPPRQLPYDAGDTLLQEYPNYTNNPGNPPWPVSYVPTALSFVIPDLPDPTWEKVWVESHCRIQRSTNLLGGWEEVCEWSVYPYAASGELPSGVRISGTQEYSDDFVRLSMKPDWSGFDLKISDYCFTNHPAMFWRTVR